MGVFGSAGSGLFMGSSTRANYNEDRRSNLEREHLQREQLRQQEKLAEAQMRQRAKEFDATSKMRSDEFSKEFGLEEKKFGLSEQQDKRSIDREKYLRDTAAEERTYNRGREAKQDEWATELQTQKRTEFERQKKTLEENAAKLQEQDDRRKMALGAFMAWFASNADGQPGSKKNAMLVKAAEPIFKEYGMPVPQDAYRTQDGKTVFVGSDGVPVAMPDDEWRGVLSEFGGVDAIRGKKKIPAKDDRPRELTYVQKAKLKALAKAVESAVDDEERRSILAQMDAIEGGGGVGTGGGTGKYVTGKTYLITHSGRKVKAVFNGVGFTLLQ